jgi:hypothetical protein
MTRRSALKPVYEPTEPKKPQTFIQKHKVLVVAIRQASPNKPARTITVRFSNAGCALHTIAFLAEKGYFARIV